MSRGDISHEFKAFEYRKGRVEKGTTVLWWRKNFPFLCWKETPHKMTYDPAWPAIGFIFISAGQSGSLSLFPRTFWKRAPRHNFGRSDKAWNIVRHLEPYSFLYSTLFKPFCSCTITPLLPTYHTIQFAAPMKIAQAHNTTTRSTVVWVFMSLRFLLIPT
jgi:hypothetical protein